MGGDFRCGFALAFQIVRIRSCEMFFNSVQADVVKIRFRAVQVFRVKRLFQEAECHFVAGIHVLTSGEYALHSNLNRIPGRIVVPPDSATACVQTATRN